MTDSDSISKISDKNIVLAGPPGSGKSCVAKEVALRLGRVLIDTDSLIEERCGMKIDLVFALNGEAFFRSMERDMAAEVASQSDLVVAAGGGMLLDPESSGALMRTGILFCLWASAETLASRIRSSEMRPVLDPENLVWSIKTLLTERNTAYARIPLRIETEGLTVNEVADRVIETLRKEAEDARQDH